MCCTRLAENTARKKSPKLRHLRHHTTLSAISSQLRHISTIGKKVIKSNISSTYPQNMVNFDPLAAEIDCRVWGTPCSRFQRVSRLGFVTAPTSVNGGPPNFAQCLAVSCAGILYIHFRGLLPPDRIFARCKIHFTPSLAFSYIGSVTALHSSSGRQPKFVAWYKEWNYGTFAEGATNMWLGGHHVGHGLTS